MYKVEYCNGSGGTYTDWAVSKSNLTRQQADEEFDALAESSGDGWASRIRIVDQDTNTIVNFNGEERNLQTP